MGLIELFSSLHELMHYSSNKKKPHIRDKTHYSSLIRDKRRCHTKLISDLDQNSAMKVL